MLSPDRILAAALRNRANREGQVERLAPVAVQAAQKKDELLAMKEDGAKVVRRVRQMRDFSSIPSFFPTPRPVIDFMLRHARIQPGNTVLEPNAGRGDLLDALAPLGVHIVAYEFVQALVQATRERGHPCRQGDFLAVTPGEVGPVDRVFMNPPFERGADIRHIQHAFTFLKPGGILVAVASSTSCTKLAEWADDNAGATLPLPDQSFAASARPTLVRTGLVIATRSFD